MNIWTVFIFKPIGFISPIVQVVLILLLLLLAIVTQYREYKKTGKTYGKYPWRISTFLSSIYEEVIFRGFILFGLMTIISPVMAIILSSVLFGLWHLKNHKWQTRKETTEQVLYAGLLFGPIVSIITILTGTIWMAVIIHYSANLLADTWRKKKL